MPLLDVTDVLFDPDFADPTLVCTRAVSTTGLNGRTILIGTDTVFTGTPVPTKSMALKREDGSEYASGSMTFITTYQLQSGSPTLTADVVTYQGIPYTIVDVDDWNYGAGFVQATGEKKTIG